VSFAYLAVSFCFARRAYRHEYGLIYGSPAPQVYGGKHGHEKAHELAIREGVEWLAMWPFYLAWGLVYRLISGPVPAEVKLSEIEKIEAEVDRLAAEQDPLNDLDLSLIPQPCPCGYLDECVIHCGDGSMCHPDPGKCSREYPAIGITGTEIIRTHHPEAIRERTFDGKIVIDIPGCSCEKCNPEPQRPPGRTYDR
jgi:hypothetical protein